MSLFVLVCTLYPLICNAQRTSSSVSEAALQVEGHATIVKNDIARAREEALRNALEKAILQTATDIVMKPLDEEKVRVMKNSISRRVDHYIKNYRITSETVQGNEYIADVDVVVAIVPVWNELSQMGVLKETGEKTSTAVSLSLKGTRKYSEFVYLKTFLQNHPKIVKSIYPCSFMWRHIQFDLVILGHVRNFSVELEKTGKYTVEVDEKSQGVVINMQVKEEVR